MSGWTVECVENMSLGRLNRLTDMYVLSPCVWAGVDGYELLIRAVPRRDDEPRLKMAEIWCGRSRDGLHFEMNAAPLVWPGPQLVDLDGCEDPTVVAQDDQIRVWYTGWNQRQETGRLLMARGPDLERVTKCGMVLDSIAPFANPKEAELVVLPDGTFRLYFEYAHEGASLIGQMESDDLDGRWSAPKRAVLHPRPKAWDCWHLSPGPVLDADTDHPTMIYNGATEAAQWRIGWARFDPGAEQDRGSLLGAPDLTAERLGSRHRHHLRRLGRADEEQGLSLLLAIRSGLAPRDLGARLGRLSPHPSGRRSGLGGVGTNEL